MKIPAYIRRCPACGHLFKADWPQEQLHCTTCQPLTINPLVAAILARMPTGF
ncbi:hypothetical protein GMSM_45990 [Geomonas sp. Red276]